MSLFSLLLKSFSYRKYTLSLSLIAIAMSVTMLLGVDRMQQQIKNGFTQTISGTDILIGPRGSALALLLSSVFNIGEQQHGLSWSAFDSIQSREDVAWAVPLAFGDSHKSFRVIGTLDDYFQYRQYANKTPLQFVIGDRFANHSEVVLGANVAASLGYTLGDEIVLSHGLSAKSFLHHQQHPFKVSGILAQTGTPVDKELYIDIHAIELLHEHQAAEHNEQTLQINAALIGAKSKYQLLELLRQLNQFEAEPITAYLPQLTLQQLWDVMSKVESGLQAISALVFVTGIISLLTNILTNLHQRHRELAIFRALGASPRHIFILLLSETVVLGLAGCFLGMVLLFAIQMLLAPMLSVWVETLVSVSFLSHSDWPYLGAMLVFIGLIGFIPACKAMRMTLNDGLQG